MPLADAGSNGKVYVFSVMDVLSILDGMANGNSGMITCMLRVNGFDPKHFPDVLGQDRFIVDYADDAQYDCVDMED